IRVETRAGVIELQITRNRHVQVDMGAPILNPAEIPFDAPAQSITYPLDHAGQTFEIGAVSMGNPHAVLLVDAVDSAPVTTLGPQLEVHPRFPQRVNVGFMEIQSRSEIKLRVWERGAGETLACGTGACAAVV